MLLYHIKVINSVDISLSSPGLALSLRYCGIKVNKAAASVPIRSFRQIRSSMDHTMAISVASAFVSLRLDYANSVL